MKGDPDRAMREKVLSSIDGELLHDGRLVILFRNLLTGRHDLRALYASRDGRWMRVLQLLPSPAALEDTMIAKCLRYDSGSKEFKAMAALQLDVADGVFLQPAYLPKTRGGV